MHWTNGAGPKPDRSPEELLAIVRDKARTMHRRQLWRGGTVVGVVLCISLAGIALSGLADDSTGSDVIVVSGASGASTTSSSAPSVARVQAPASSVDPAEAPSTTAGRPFTNPATTAPTTTTAVIECRNSEDPSCGPFFWDPAPAPDQPLSVRATHSPAEPRAGEAITFHVVAEDPDSRILRSFNIVERYSDGTGGAWRHVLVSCIARFGLWDAPQPEPDRYETTFTHAFREPGTYEATFGFESSGSCGHPYGSEGETTVTVVVSA